MTLLRRSRSLSLVLSLALSLLVLGTASGTSVPAPEPTSPSEVVGSSPDALVCIACVAGGVTIVTGGLTSVVVAASARGSTIAAITCALACASALS